MSFLGLSSEGGNTKYLRFMPSANSWVLQKEEIQIKKILFDISSIKTGWGLMQTGESPVWAWDEVVGRAGKKPEGDYKRGFSIRAYLGPQKGWCEWSSTGTGPALGMDALMSEVVKQQKGNEGKALACSYDGSEPMKIGKGNTRKPIFTIIGWVAMPADDAEDEDVAPPPTKAKAKAAPVSLDDEF